MIKRIIDFSVRNKLFIGITVLFLMAGGIYSMLNIPVDAVPDITSNQVQIVTVSPSLAPQEVEKFITYPVEVSMANILHVKNIRSISRYGLSVVTVVFEDDVPVLDARQLVNEQLQLVLPEIPEGMGSPQLMPITTGLGEIYQYTLEVEKGYEGKYNPTELRTIQDWIVKRQLSGIQGIVETSSFGGFLKQYEVAVDPDILSALNLTIPEVTKALTGNNANTGGSYIEKQHHAYYIRAEGLVNDIQEIENIVVTNRNGSPVLIKDLAEVGIGSAQRYGAMTKNGEGEAVGGITLMLKGANSSQVIEKVKTRIAQIQETLPEGIYIKPYLDRSRLVSKTIHTVTENLVIGGLIVIFVLILLLGNIRAGAIVASVIPLSLLFAFIMMNLFGVSANLMSLGAIDFGIVVDGAVIIVESIVFSLFQHHKGKYLNQEEMDQVVMDSTSNIYKSAAFGVFIILIVFLPIMSLTGIEGKTFKPMAQTVSFAILGAFILAVTYVPMMSSLLLNKKVMDKRTFSDKLIRFLKLTYHPVLKASIANKKLVLGVTLVIFGMSIWGFSRLGGEFLPTLQEGDLAMQMTIPPGSSLKQSIETTTKAEKILLDNFPEVTQVISKIGTAEVPTDPMAIEDADIMIILKDQDEWVSAENNAELISKMKAALSVITAASFDFTQPIQLRFNELLTGAKTDVAIKIFGEDMQELNHLGNEAAAIVNKIPGAADVKVEQTAGLPQYLVQYNRKKIARNGVNIENLNEIIRSAYAGENAGVVFEGERKFDLVVRLDQKHINELDLTTLYIKNSDDKLIPLSELAQVEYVEGPMQISRDETKRNITVGVNVRNRDTESLVEDIQSSIKSELTLPPGYYVSYGGEFQNLVNAKQRLSYAVPAALALIMILLFFAFNSIKYALLIFTAVPLSAVGGIGALALRNMPFSISAGVGFIALFGVAVLNGIVLISYYNQLREQGIENIRYIIIKGACMRLRPVMMTALVASLGFLPMAVSTSEGAEVQRPLATVVIGGLITSTLLTMIILPILYELVNRKYKVRLGKRTLTISMSLLFMTAFLFKSNAQDNTSSGFKMLTYELAEKYTRQNHPVFKNGELKIQAAEAQKNGILDFKPTEFSYQYGQINSDALDYNFEINQNFGSILTHIRKNQLVNHEISRTKLQVQITQNKILADLKAAYYEWLYAFFRMEILKRQSELYEDFERIAALKYEYGDAGLVRKSLAATKVAESRSNYLDAVNHHKLVSNELHTFFMKEEDFIPPFDSLPQLAYEPLNRHPDSGSIYLDLYEYDYQAKKKLRKIEQSRYFPEITAGYFNQQIDQVSGFSGWQAGLSVPLWFFPRKAAVEEAKLQEAMAMNELHHQQYALNKTIHNHRLKIQQLQNQLNYLRNNALKSAGILINTIQSQYEKENIEYYEYLEGMSTANDIKLKYLKVLNEYNQEIIRLNRYYSRSPD